MTSSAGEDDNLQQSVIKCREIHEQAMEDTKLPEIRNISMSHKFSWILEEEEEEEEQEKEEEENIFILCK